MKPMTKHPLDAGLAERLATIFELMMLRTTVNEKGWEAVAAEVRKIVKEATKERA